MAPMTMKRMPPTSFTIWGGKHRARKAPNNTANKALVTRAKEAPKNTASRDWLSAERQRAANWVLSPSSARKIRLKVVSSVLMSNLPSSKTSSCQRVMRVPSIGEDTVKSQRSFFRRLLIRHIKADQETFYILVSDASYVLIRSELFESHFDVGVVSLDEIAQPNSPGAPTSQVI